MEFPFDEEWKDVIGFEGIYKVSNFGRIKNIKSHRFLKIGRYKGYSTVTFNIKINERYKQITGQRVDVIVAFAFLGIPYNFESPYVNHKDGNQYNNKIDNLEWTYKPYVPLYKGKPTKIINVYYCIDNTKYLIMSDTITRISIKLNLAIKRIKTYINSNKPIRSQVTNKEYYLESL